MYLVVKSAGQTQNELTELVREEAGGNSKDKQTDAL